MTLNDFSITCEKSKVALIYSDGVYIGKRNNGKQIAVLYQLEGFYVEIVYSKYRSIISHIICFASTQKLAPYLKQIDIEEVVKCFS